MRLLLLILLTLCVALQYRLWFGQHSVKEYLQHKEELRTHQSSNLELEKRNKMLQADVADLQQGLIQLGRVQLQALLNFCTTANLQQTVDIDLVHISGA